MPSATPSVRRRSAKWTAARARTPPSYAVAAPRASAAPRHDNCSDAIDAKRHAQYATGTESPTHKRGLTCETCPECYYSRLLVNLPQTPWLCGALSHDVVERLDEALDVVVRDLDHG